MLYITSHLGSYGTRVVNYMYNSKTLMTHLRIQLYDILITSHIYLGIEVIEPN